MYNHQSLIEDNIQHVSVSQPTLCKMKKTILPFPICCCALVLVILVSLGTEHSGLPILDLIAEIWHWPNLPLAAQSRYIWVCGEEAGTGWLWFQRVSCFPEHTGWKGIASDRTAHWNSPERLSLLPKHRMPSG